MPALHYEWNSFIVLGQRSILKHVSMNILKSNAKCMHNLFSFPRFNIHVKRLNRVWDD